MGKKIMTGVCSAVGIALVCGLVIWKPWTGFHSAESGEDFVRQTVLSVEAEDGVLGGNANISDDGGGYSGSGFVTGFENDGDKLEMSFDINDETFYDLDFYCAMIGGYKENYVLVDGETVGNISGDNEDFEAFTIPHVYLTAGNHTVSVQKYWGYVKLDKIEIMTSAPVSDSIYADVSKELVNPNASDNAKRLYKYLVDNYGKNIISGQYCDEGAFGHEMAVIWKETGKFPAILGLDMIEYSPSRVENGSQGSSIDKAIEAWENNIPVTMCWHWNAPSKYLTGQWYSGFYKDYTNIDLDKIMNGEDDEGYELLVSDMDAIAGELIKLRDADVPVLWRPLHEASGGWFWWGDCEADSYLKLYDLMYDKFVNEYELNNLIWVWNGQDAGWYPGDDKVDIIGTDIYPGEHVYTSQYPKYIECVNVPQSVPGTYKLVTLSENGCLFDPDLAVRDGAMWSYIGTWSGEFVSESGSFNVYSEKYTESDVLKKFYNHENVITRDELPDLATYGEDK